MSEIDNAIKQAIDNLGVDNLKVTKEQIKVIKDNLINKEKDNETVNELMSLSMKDEKVYGKK